MNVLSKLASILGGWLLPLAMLAGCEGAITGKEIARFALQPAEGGAPGHYAPVKFQFTPEMNPVAVNFRADFTMNMTEAGKWNSYRATLTREGNVVAMRNFNVNHPAAGPDQSPPASNTLVHTLFYIDVPSAGDYELVITAVSPPPVTLASVHADARRNVQRPPK